MGANTVDKQLGALREGDEAIAGALSELDTKLTEWLSAMRAGQAALECGLLEESGREGEAPAEPHAPASSQTVAASEPASTGAGQVPLDGEAGTPSEPDVVAPPVSAARKDTDPDLHRDGTRSGGGMFETPAPTGGNVPANGPEHRAETASDVRPSPEDDEALLAQLDEETASAIRVKRRLSNNQRSVQELLEEIRAEQKPTDGKTQPRTQWWRRANEQQGG